MNDYRPKRAWVPEWLWRIVKHVAVWEPFTTLFTEPFVVGFAIALLVWYGRR